MIVNNLKPIKWNDYVYLITSHEREKNGVVIIPEIKFINFFREIEEREGAEIE